jgi:beta-phosphoglucomutase family hydrolase
LFFITTYCSKIIITFATAKNNEISIMHKYHFDAVIFDLDGVITKTATVHSRAWKKMFDEYLRFRNEKYGEPFKEFSQDDYLAYVDGKPRYDGVKSFLESRNIKIPFGTPDDTPDMETVCGLGNKKNFAFNEVLKYEGVEVYESTVKLMNDLHNAGIHIGVASSSKNCEAVLNAAGLMHLVETRVDGVVSAQLGLKGKPEPDIFIKAAENLGVKSYRSVVVEDAVSGVAAGRNGNFGYVLGVAREGNKKDLLINGADEVVADLEETSIDKMEHWFVSGLEKDGWRLDYHDYDADKERSREALLTVGNGYFGTRGALEEAQAGGINYPGTYIAGVYNKLTTKVAGKEVVNEDFVNCPNWLAITFKVEDGMWINPANVEITDIERSIDFKTGLLSRKMTVKDEDGNVTEIESYRFASMDNMHTAALKYKITPVNYSGLVSVVSMLNGAIINQGVERYKSLNSKHLKPVEQGGDANISYVKVKTVQSDIEIAEAAKLNVQGVDNSNIAVSTEEGMAISVFEKYLEKGETLIVEKLVSIYTSNDDENPLMSALETAKRLTDFDRLFNRSEEAWGKIWQKADIKLTGDRLAQKLLRMHIYHLMVSASPHNKYLDAGITARGLHGEAYRGHIFWDELFVLPFYDIHFPETARALLMYRYRRLGEAKKYARQFGYKGAMFPWQSGSTGAEETQTLHLNPVSGKWGDDYSSLQRHVSLAVAYNVWEYFHITNDTGFLENYGLEMILEICRFWESKTVWDNTKQRYSIDKVMGPDEFHEKYPGADEGGLKDNAYTNIMVAWLFKKAGELTDKISAEAKEKIFDKIGFSTQELEKWNDIRKKLRLVISGEGIIAQYDGYFDLKELDWDYYRKKYGNVYRMDRLLKAEGKSADEYKVAKQADTLMVFYNLEKQEVDSLLNDMGYKLPADYLEKNLKYYLARTSHGSTLSRVVHAKLAEMVGDKKLGFELYRDALTSDYNDIQGGTTGEGIHVGVMGGTILIALFTYAGINIKGEMLSVNPQLPQGWEKMSFGLTFKKTSYNLTAENINVEIEADTNTDVLIFDRIISVEKNEKIIVSK